MQFTMQNLETSRAELMPPGFQWQQATYRRNRKTNKMIETRFGPVTHLDELLDQVRNSKGDFEPVSQVGRDGVMIQTRPFWEEASSGTLAVFNRSRRRLGTVYLGQMIASTAQQKRRRGLKGKKKDYIQSLNYLKKYRQHMDYAERRAADDLNNVPTSFRVWNTATCKKGRVVVEYLDSPIMPYERSLTQFYSGTLP